MKTSLDVKRILLYGDSFVYGKVSGENARLDSKTRFSGVLQDLLGDNYEIIEEGLRARMLAGENGFFSDRDGLAQFGPIIGSHLAFDLLVLFLGTNDCNAKSKKTPKQIAESLKDYLPVLKSWCEFLAVPEPKVLIVAPPKINKASYDVGAKQIFGEGAAVIASGLKPFYEQVANELNTSFLNAADFCQPAGGDGIHLDAAGNYQLARGLYDKIQELESR